MAVSLLPLVPLLNPNRGTLVFQLYSPSIRVDAGPHQVTCNHRRITVDPRFQMPDLIIALDTRIN